ncbi:MAG: iron-containing alcohol dehydrogenase [Proteobacteria bacterium]|nr:iron-containing alcohol dehydrogenase [Pseudomonadota bacterium]MBU1738736.1 iron-containing alcohol dehydrogenase [Pseudomonadota bacterium]
MKDFVLQLTTKIIFGRNKISEIGNECRSYGRKALLVYGGGSIRKNGIYDTVTDSLRAAGIEIIEHPGVVSNPVLSHVRDGIALARQNDVDMVIAVGGGSVIDSAKAIGAGMKAEHDVWQFFKGKKSVKEKLPLLCVLTIAAAGSEMNGGMVLTNEETKHKFGVGSQLLKPEVSILDPAATFSVPPDYTVYGAVDAIAHILEFYFTTQEPAPVQDRLMEGLVINIMDSCERVLADPHDFNGRGNLLWCATLALNGITAAGLGMVGFPMHMIEHSLSALYNVPHGAGLSVVMPAWMKWRSERFPTKFAQFGRRVFGITERDDRKAADEGIKLLHDWFVKVDSPVTLAQLNIPESELPQIAENALALAKLWRLGEYDRETIIKILKYCNSPVG